MVDQDSMQNVEDCSIPIVQLLSFSVQGLRRQVGSMVLLHNKLLLADRDLFGGKLWSS